MSLPSSVDATQIRHGTRRARRVWISSASDVPPTPQPPARLPLSRGVNSSPHCPSAWREQPVQPQPTTSAFGAPAQATSAFGAPAQTTSAFGQSSFGQSAFGQASQAQSSVLKPASSAFGGTGGGCRLKLFSPPRPVGKGGTGGTPPPPNPLPGPPWNPVGCGLWNPVCCG